jgi:hypothetical protein
MSMCFCISIYKQFYPDAPGKKDKTSLVGDINNRNSVFWKDV